VGRPADVQPDAGPNPGSGRSHPIKPRSQACRASDLKHRSGRSLPRSPRRAHLTETRTPTDNHPTPHPKHLIPPAAIPLRADLLLMDDRKGVIVARSKGLRVTGTLGVLDIAAERGLVDFAQAINRLRRTTFRIPEALLDSLLKKYAPND